MWTHRRPGRRPLRAPHRRGPGARHRHGRRPDCPGSCRRPTPASRRTAYEIEVTRRAARRRDVPRRRAPSRSSCPGRRRRWHSRERGDGAGPRRRHGDDWSDWSDPATVEAGLLVAADWIGALHQPRRARRTGRARRPCSAGRARRARARSRAPGCTPPRTASTRPTLNGQRGRRPGAGARLDQLRSTGCATRPTTSPTWSGPGDNEPRGAARQRLVPRAARLPGRRALYGDRLALLAQLEVTTADGAVHVLATDGSWTARESGVLADDLYDGQRTDLRRDGARPRSGEPVEVVEADLSRLVAPDGPPVRVTGIAARPRGLDARRRANAGRLRPEPRRLGAAAGPRRRAGHRGDRPARRGARGRRARRPAAAHAPRPPTRYLLAGRRRGGAGADASRSTASATPRSPACRTSTPRTSRPSSSAPTCAAPAGSSARTTCSTGSTRTSSGACAATSSTSRPTARSATSGSAGPATSRSSRRPPASCSTPPASSPPGSPTWPPSSSRTARCPFVVPDVHRTAPARAAAAWGDAATLVPWVLYERTGDRDLLDRQLPSMRAWVDQIVALAGDGPPVDRRIPVRRLARPGRAAGPARAGARPTPTLVATAYLARSAELVAQAARRCSATTTSPQRTPARGARSASAFAARVRHRRRPRAQRRARPRYALALQWDLLPTRDQRRHGRATAGRPRAGRRLPHRHRLRRHAARSPTR